MATLAALVAWGPSTDLLPRLTPPGQGIEPGQTRQILAAGWLEDAIEEIEEILEDVLGPEEDPPPAGGEPAPEPDPEEEW